MNDSPRVLPTRLGISMVLAATLLAPAQLQARYGVSTIDQAPAFTLAGEHASLIGAGRPAAWVAANNRCVARLVSGEVDAARRDCDSALDTVPSQLGLRAGGRRLLAGLHANRGVVRALQGEAGGAEADFRRALELDGGHRDARENLARLLSDAAAR
jgi:Flp pilus assembly protein TadD